MAKEQTIRYQAYHDTRAKLGITQNYLRENGGVYVVVREHHGRFAFHLTPQATQYFPHHGHPVINAKTGKLEIVRMADLLINPDRYTGITISDDLEATPFYFLRDK